MPFSDSLTVWLSDHASFVNETFAEDLQGGRALGPASGTLWDAYPFLRGCAYSGLFAGLSISGVPADLLDIYLLEYSASQGFVPALAAPFSGDQWQDLTGDQWKQISPQDYTPCNFEPPVHAADLRFSVGGEEFDTRGWEYHCRLLSPKYMQHSWTGEGLCIVAVTFVDRPEHAAPFLRPCFVSGKSARLDPQCLYSVSPYSRLFSGRVVLVPGTQTDLSVQESTVTFTRKIEADAIRAVRTISHIEPNAAGNFSCISSGCCRFTCFVDEADPAAHTVRLSENEICVQNACGSCCHCEDYIHYYETLRTLALKQTALIEQFSSLYAQSVQTRNRLEAVLRAKVRLVQVRLGEWGSDNNGFYMVFFVIVSAADAVKPPAIVLVSFTRGGDPLTVRSAALTGQSAALSMSAGVASGGAAVRLSGITANITGAKTVRMLVRFNESMSTGTFDSSAIHVTVTNGTI